MPILEIKKVSVIYQKPYYSKLGFKWNPYDAEYGIKNVSLKMDAGERIGIIGAKNSGKTALMKIVAGINLPSKGVVYSSNNTISFLYWH